jgi:hypothetical protein
MGSAVTRARQLVHGRRWINSVSMSLVPFTELSGDGRPRLSDLLTWDSHADSPGQGNSFLFFFGSNRV